MFLRDFTFAFGSNLSVKLMSVLTGILLARMLGAEGKGIYTVAMALPIMVAAIGQLGLGQALIYYMRQGVLTREQVLGTLILIDLVLATGLFFLAIWGAPELSTSLFRGLDLTLIIVAALFIPVRLVVSQLHAVLRALGYIRAFSAFSVLQSASTLVAIILIWFGGELSVAKILAAQLALELIIAACCAFSACRGMKMPQISFGSFGKLLWFGLRSHIVYTLALFERRFDILLVNAFLDPAHVGIYTVSVGLAQLVSVAANSITVVLYPKISGASAQSIVEFVPPISRSTLLLSLLLAAVLILIGKLAILYIYGVEFAPAYIAMLLLLPGTIMWALSVVCENYLRGTGRPGITSWVAALSLTANILMNIILIPQYGIAGAAVASSVSYSLRAVTLMSMVVYLTKISVAELVVPRRSDIDTALQHVFRFVGRRPSAKE